jgi:hypothetical protein
MSTKKEATKKTTTKSVKTATPKAPKPPKLTLTEAKEQLLAAGVMIEALNKSIDLLNEQLDQERETRLAYAGQAMMLEAVKAELAEEKSKETNTIIEEKIIEKTKVIKGNTEYITQYVDREVIKKEEVIKYIENCPVPQELIDLHNQATELNKAAEAKK